MHSRTRAIQASTPSTPSTSGSGQSEIRNPQSAIPHAPSFDCRLDPYTPSTPSTPSEKPLSPAPEEREVGERGSGSGSPNRQSSGSPPPPSLRSLAKDLKDLQVHLGLPCPAEYGQFVNELRGYSPLHWLEIQSLTDDEHAELLEYPFPPFQPLFRNLRPFAKRLKAVFGDALIGLALFATYYAVMLFVTSGAPR